MRAEHLATGRMKMRDFLLGLQSREICIISDILIQCLQKIQICSNQSQGTTFSSEEKNFKAIQNKTEVICELRDLDLSRCVSLAGPKLLRTRSASAFFLESSLYYLDVSFCLSLSQLLPNFENWEGQVSCYSGRVCNCIVTQIKCFSRLCGL